MKIFISIIIVFLFFGTALAQPCLPDGITFNTQMEIDSFYVWHPDCTETLGDVKINGASINNLDGLNVINSIGGFLHMSGNPVLVNLSGLNNLSSIGGDLWIDKFRGIGKLNYY